MIGRCLILFSIGGYRGNQYITSIGLFYKKMGFYLEGVWLAAVFPLLLTVSCSGEMTASKIPFPWQGKPAGDKSLPACLKAEYICFIINQFTFELIQLLCIIISFLLIIFIIINFLIFNRLFYSKFFSCKYAVGSFAIL